MKNAPSRATPATDPTTAPATAPTDTPFACGSDWLSLGAVGCVMTVCVTTAPLTVLTMMLVTGAGAGCDVDGVDVIRDDEDDDDEDGVGVGVVDVEGTSVVDGAGVELDGVGVVLEDGVLEDCCTVSKAQTSHSKKSIGLVRPIQELYKIQ